MLVSNYPITSELVSWWYKTKPPRNSDVSQNMFFRRRDISCNISTGEGKYQQKKESQDLKPRRKPEAVFFQISFKGNRFSKFWSLVGAL